jgi:hypothetical protein
VADECARALRPDRHEAAEVAFCALPGQTRHDIRAARAAFHRHRSPFVRLGEALDDAKHWAANLLRPERAAQRQPLAGAIAALGRRPQGG